MSKKLFTTEQLMDFTETWLTTGELNIETLAEDFIFTSPFWKRAKKAEFINKFEDAETYRKTALSKIVKFDPIIKLTELGGKHFSIIIQYHTKNGSAVYETLLGKVRDGKLTELRSIYDLAETKKALDID